MTRSYFFVRTPIQYFNALEAKNQLVQNNNCTLIIISDYPPTLKQFDKLIDRKIWSKVIFPWRRMQLFINFNILNRVINIYRKYLLKKILITIKDSDKIFWGNYNSIWLRYFLTKKNAKSVTILDDGFATLSVVENLKNETIQFNKSLNVSGFMERILVCNSTNIPLRKLYFFTSFENITPRITQRTINTEYLYLREQVNKNILIEKKMFFIGQPLIRLSLMSKERYIKNVNKILEFYKKKGLMCFYIPHRTSGHNNFPEHWNVKHFNFPLENLLFQNEEKLPKVMASFYSSALYFINKFFQNDKLNFEYWEASDFRKNSVIKNCFSYLKKEKNKNTIIHKIDI